ncbi:MAG: hypothetical protein J2P25_02580 [Nocardiopsaceae bacterium]|nr:hypothetical protein [Nocardiopsaceae bacterium]
MIATSMSRSRSARDIPYASASSRQRRGTSTSRSSGSASAGSPSGAHHIIMLKTSSARVAHLARSKSISATASPSRKTTFSGVISTCPMSSGG